MDFQRQFRMVLAACKRIKSAQAVFDISRLRSGVYALRWSGRQEAFTAIVNLEQRFGEMSLSSALKGQDMLTGNVVDLPGGPGAPPAAIPTDPLIVAET